MESVNEKEGQMKGKKNGKETDQIKEVYKWRTKLS